MKRYKLVGYDLDGVERDVRAEVERCGRAVTMRRAEHYFDAHEDGLIPEDGPSWMEVTDRGYCHIHWSIPFGIVLEDIVKEHRILEEVPDDDEQEGDQGGQAPPETGPAVSDTQAAEEGATGQAP